MTEELLSFLISLGQTFMKNLPISLGIGDRFHRADLALGLQSG